MKYLFLICVCFSISVGYAQRISIQYDTASPQATYAAEALKRSVLRTGYILNDSQAEFQIVLEVAQDLAKEEFVLHPVDKKIIIKGGDGTGIIYGTFSLIDDLTNGIAIQNVKRKTEKPRLAFRGIKYDLPWDTYRHSYSLTQHQATCSDVGYWKGFLDMMAENRFNVLTLWNLHPYTFMIEPKNFPEASPWNDTEMAQWKNLFGNIFRWRKNAASIPM